MTSNINNILIATISTVLALSGCGGSESSTTEVIKPAGQLPTDISIGEASSPPQEFNAIEQEAPVSAVPVAPEATEQTTLPQEKPTEIGADVTNAIVGPLVTITPALPDARSWIKVSHEENGYENHDIVYDWYKNGDLVSTTKYPNTAFNQTKVKGDVISVVLRASYGGELVQSESDEVVVGNIAPRFNWAVIVPENPTNRDTLSILSDVEDSDGDELEFSYSWEGYDSEIDTLEGSSIFPVNPEVTALITVNDGYENKSYSVTKRLSVYEELYYKHSLEDLEFDQTISFELGFIDDRIGVNNNTTLLTGPHGMVYEDGWVTWTPQSLINGSTETFYAHFESERGKREIVEFVINNSDNSEPTRSVSQVDSESNASVPGCDFAEISPVDSKTYCLKREEWVSCYADVCDVSTSYALEIFEADLTHVNYVPLLSIDDSGVSGVETTTHSEGSLPSPPNSMVLFATRNELLFSTSGNKLYFVSADTGLISWSSDAPATIEERIESVDCPDTASSVTQCEFLTYDGFVYSVD